MGRRRSGHGGLLRPPELSAIHPDAAQNDGQHADHGNPRLPGSNSSCKPDAPGLQGRPALHFREQHVGGLIEACAREGVSTFGDPTLAVRLGGLVALGHEPEIGFKLASPSQPGRIINGGEEGQCCNRPHAGHGH
jgi:hypothetical protein